MADPSTSQNQNHTATATTTTTTETATAAATWGTLEELLLASAVQRYGTNSWDSIAKELQNRTTFSLLTPVTCQQKYRDLKRRFASETPSDGAANTAWLDELRRLRVAELRRELQRYDHSIVSLQLKVKRLKEERESSNNNDNNNVKEHEIKDEEQLDKTEFDPSEEKETEKEVIEIADVKNEPVEPEADRPPGPVGDLCNSAESTRSNSKRRERVDSDELVESVAESKDDGGGGGEGGGGGAKAKKESSDVQSTVSLWRTAANINTNDEDDNDNDDNKVNEGNEGGVGGRREKRKVVLSGTSSGEENQSAVVKANIDGKSEALVEFLEVVRGRKIGSFFERRLLSQETQKYKSLIKQHIDLETIQKRLEEGQYSDCQTKFYRDFMLLINNTIIFFTRRSAEHKAALELRQLLSKQFQSHMTSPPGHKSPKPTQPAPLPKPTKPEPNLTDSFDKQPKLTITGPVIACRKRSSIAGKSSRGGERKETPLVSPSDEKLSSLGAKIRQQGQKTPSTSFNAVTKKRTRDQSFGSRSSSSKSNRNPSPSTPISGKGENSEAKADKKRQSPGSSTKMKQGSGFGSIKGTLLLESLKNSERRKTGDDNSGGGNVKSDKRKDEGPKSGSGSKLAKEKGKGKEREIALDKEKGKGKERESTLNKEKPKGKGKEEREIILGKEKVKGKEEKEDVGSRSNRRPPKRAAAIAAMGKRGRDGSEAEPQSKKRQRK